MFADFIKRLTAPAPEPMGPVDARLALGALLVRMARADNDYAPAEVARIDMILRNRYGLDADAAAALRTQCEGIEAEAPDTVRFTRAIKEAVPYVDRLQVVEALWQVVLVDDRRDAMEDAQMRQIAPLLGVSDIDSNQARLRVLGDDPTA